MNAESGFRAAMAPLVDTHAHLTSRPFRPDLEDVLARARQAGVTRIINVGTTAADSRQCVADARRFSDVPAAVAIHPNDIAAAAAGDWDTICALAAEPEVVAIGETGLDRYRDRTPFPLQEAAFERHLELARSQHLPVIIHCRDAYPDVIGHLERLTPPIRGVLHSFSGTQDDAQALLALGLHLSFAGVITFTNKGIDPLRAVAGWVPRDRLLIETDCPYLTPHPYRGQRNEPAHVRLTAERLAQVRGLSIEDLAAATTANAQALFTRPGALAPA